MKHENDMYSIAWFKLAECVARREQERAFGLYRLLAHSFDDQAFAQQLAGDLYRAFDDDKSAIEKYEQAAYLYEQGGRSREAAAVYDHLKTINPDEKRYQEAAASAWTAAKSAKMMSAE